MKFVRRFSIVLILVLGLSGVVWPQVRHLRREHQVKETLLTIQRALQDYHVKEERYVPDLEMSGAELISVLLESGFLEEPPLNPYTGESYQLEETTDRIRYRTDELFETYSLQALHFDRDEVWLEIDSVEHHSLE